MKIQDKSQAKFVLDSNGYLVTTAKLARIGPMQYLGEEIGKQSGKVYDVYVDESDLFNDATIKSFEGVSVTVEHPTEMEVNAHNWKELAVGHISNVRRDGDFLIGDVVVNDSKAIKIVQDGKIEVSCGYDAELVEADGKIKKVDIKGNHLAIVDEGRCGDKCKLGDGKPSIMSKLLTRFFGDKKTKLRAKLGDSKKRLVDAKGELKQKLVDLEEVVSSDAPVEEKAAAIAELSEEAVALTEEVAEVQETIAELSAEIEQEAPAETPTNDQMTAEEEAKVADLEAQVQEKDAKIAELEAELETLKEKEAQATTANDAKRVFPKLAIKDSMSSVEIKRAVVMSTGAYDKESVKTLADCALNSAYAAALTVGAKTNNIGSKLLANDSKAQTKQLPKALRKGDK